MLHDSCTVTPHSMISTDLCSAAYSIGYAELQRLLKAPVS